MQEGKEETNGDAFRIKECQLQEGCHPEDEYGEERKRRVNYSKFVLNRIWLLEQLNKKVTGPHHDKYTELVQQ